MFLNLKTKVKRHKKVLLGTTRYYSINPKFAINDLSPWWVTGITDAKWEGNFSINFNANSNKIHASFKITQKSHSKGILLSIKKFFGCGVICKDNNNESADKFVVNKVEDLLNVILPHFDIYPLVSSKHLDYLDFRKAVGLFKNGSRFVSENKDLILYIKQGMNKSRSFEERWKFYKFTEIPTLEPEWIQAFIDGEGSFQFLTSDTVNRGKSYLQVYSRLEIAQNSHDIKLLAAIIKIF